jgi:hypothetical protein
VGRACRGELTAAREGRGGHGEDGLPCRRACAHLWAREVVAILIRSSDEPHPSHQHPQPCPALLFFASEGRPVVLVGIRSAKNKMPEPYPPLTSSHTL